MGEAAAAHVVVADLADPRVEPDDRRHLGASLRLRPGEAVGATDGRGGYRLCRWVGDGIEAAGEIEVSGPRMPAVTVAFAPVKGDRPEWAVQKLAELGVDRIVLLAAARSVVTWDGARASAHLERLRRVARQAVMQSRGRWLPTVDGMVPVAAMVTGPGVALAHPDGGAPSLDHPTVLVGPEGGWDGAELAAAGALTGLGPSVLRAETAAVAAGVILCALRAGTVGPPV